jgi:Ca-activated chloride channel homolog
MNFNDTFQNTFGALEFIRPYWLLGVLVVIIFSLWRYQRQSSQQTTIIASHLSEHLVTLPETTQTNRFALNLLAIIACIALSGPSIRSVKLPVYEMQTAQVIAFDLSYSMYATDITPNRLSRAKYKAIDLLKQWQEGDKGLIAYAGDAFTITPLTKDSNSIINHIPNLSPDLMPVRGSRPDLALEKAISLLTNAGYQQGHVVFITDGFDKSSADKMQEMVKGTKWMVSVLGMATTAGAPIKLQDGSLLKDNSDNIVIPKLDTNTLMPVTKINDGIYVKFNSANDDINRLASQYSDHHIDKQQSNTVNNTENKQLIDDGYWLSFLLIPLFLLLFRKGVFYAALLTIMLPLSNPKVEASIWKNDQQNAYQAFEEGNYKAASEQFDTPAWKASALFKDKQYKQAEAIYLSQKNADPKNKNTLYNLGNTQAIQQKYQEALASYNEALALDPNFKQAQDNKAAVEALLKQQEQQQNNKDQQKDDQSSQDKQDQSSSDQQKGNQQQDQQSNSEQEKDEQKNQHSDSAEPQDSQQQNQSNEGQQDKQSNADQTQDEQQQNQQSDSTQQDNVQQQENQASSSEQAEQEAQQVNQNQSPQTTDEQASDDKTEQQANAEIDAEQQNNQEYEDLPIWLKNVPDDPSLLLRNKMQLEYQKRSANKPVIQKNNGEIW